VHFSNNISPTTVVLIRSKLAFDLENLDMVNHSLYASRQSLEAFYDAPPVSNRVVVAHVTPYRDLQVLGVRDSTRDRMFRGDGSSTMTPERSLTVVEAAGPSGVRLKSNVWHCVLVPVCHIAYY